MNACFLRSQAGRLLLLCFAPAASWAFESPLSLRNAAPGVEYTGSRVCAGCHKAIYDRFIRTAMGRSISPALPAGFPLPATAGIASLNRRLEVFEKAGRMVLAEIETAGGIPVFNQTRPLDWAIGSGENGITFAVQRGGYLFEAPLSYYARTRRWDLSPGYELADEGFSRPITADCLVCHAGRAQPLATAAGRYADPPFAEAAIGCENCHGPGQLHVRERASGARQIPDASIVNPARLPSRLAEDICMRCHQAGQARALLPGRKYGDFRPGTRLIDTVAIAEPAAAAKDADLLEHHDSMQSSRCFAASGGKLGCLTCHDPHEQPAPVAAPAYFRARCLQCHNASSCRLSLEKRRASSPPDNCIGCHMPRRDIGLIAHSALTDHRIPARPGQAIPSRLPALGGIPGVRVVNAPDGSSELPLLTHLELLGVLRDRDPQLTPLYTETLAAAARALPNEPLVLAVLGRNALAADSPDAADLLSRAEKTETGRAGFAPASTYIDLGEALLKAGRTPEAVAALERGTAAHPWSKEIRKRLVLACIRQKDYPKSAATLTQYVADFPEDSFMRSLLKQVSARP